MANRMGIISPIKKEHDTANGQIKSLGSSLQELGYAMFPGTKKRFVPYKEKNGEYRTGLDPNALYIKKMTNEAERQQEIARVTELKNEIENLTNLDLGPRSNFYSKMWELQGIEAVASDVALIDKDNMFDLDDVLQLITFAWLRVHPEIAPSYDAWKRGHFSYRCPVITQCLFFVNDIEHEAKMEYSLNTRIDKATHDWYSMNPLRRMKVARLLGLPVNRMSSDEIVYNLGKKYITDSKDAAAKTANLENFLKIAEMHDENLEVRFKIKEAIEYNVYREGRKPKGFYEGDEKLADTEQELVEMLSSPKNQDIYLALIKKIETAKSVEV